VLFQNGQAKGLLRNLVEGLVPEKIRLAPKRHIQTPQSAWLNGSLRNRIGDIFRSRSFRERGIFDIEQVEQTFQSIKGQPLKNSFFLWQAVNLENWFTLFI